MDGRFVQAFWLKVVCSHVHGCTWTVMLLVSITEEVGHIFCACDYALRLNGNDCVFYVPNLASLVPTSL